MNPYQERARISSIKPDGGELDLYTRYGLVIYCYFWVRLAKLACGTSFYAHFACCIYYFLAAMNPYQERARISSIKPDGGELDLYTRYGLVIYWSLSTFTTNGYGDFHDENAIDKLFSSIYMLLSFYVSTYVAGNIPI
ncbi:potassium channel AKT2/3 [Artemisia annua]|uniref:Potassium channel AKT2/3 n=1 Tax=Artemisia annua TaxID=35608 RepID=A0A2U1QJA6_ARTAN|nr:potassium channel AKT2/3 [Artemisia annua]